MKRYTPDEIKSVLEAHTKWLRNEEGGSRANLRGADLSEANLIGAYLDGANLSRANLIGANLSRANLSGANLRGAYLDGADLSGANLGGTDLRGANLKIHCLEVFAGLYNYHCWAIVTDQGVPWVRMGCLWKSVEDWDAMGIRQSNEEEFPDDGSEKCERRVRAFEFTRCAALAQAEKFRIKKPTQATA